MSQNASDKNTNNTNASNNNGGMLPPPNRPASSATSGDRHMNDSTMPPPRYAAAKKSTSNSSPRKSAAVNVRARFGLHDWKRLITASNDLAQRKGDPLRRDIPEEEVRKHNKNHDGWIILRGKVYNVGPYLPYHPGGIAIFKNILGKDATTLFDKYHRWVNIDGLIGPLLLGSVAMNAPKPNAFSVVPPKESHLTNAPRVSAQAASGSSLLSSPVADGDDDVEEQILPLP